MIAKARDEDRWQDCQPGQLLQIVSRARQARRQRRILRGAPIVALGLLVLAAGSAALNRWPAAVPLAPLTCREVIEWGPQYAAGTLSAEQTARMEQHLAVCPACLTLIESQPVAARSISGPRSQCGCRHGLPRGSADRLLARVEGPRVVRASGVTQP